MTAKQSEFWSGKRLLALASLCALGLATGPTAAQPATAGASAPAASAATPATNAAFVLRGAQFDGRAFDLAALRGRAVLIFYWSTDCVVCMNKWPELRANAQGWRNKPFALVSVNVDARPDAWRDYERLVAGTHAATGNLTRLWAGDPSYVDALVERPRRLPLTLVLDRQGKVVTRIEGRIAPEAWDNIAELLP